MREIETMLKSFLRVGGLDEEYEVAGGEDEGDPGCGGVGEEEGGGRRRRGGGTESICEIGCDDDE